MRRILAFFLELAILVIFLQTTTQKTEARDLEISIFLPGGAYDTQILSQFEKSLGIKFYSTKLYLDWTDSFPSEAAQGLNNHGTVPEVTWQPQENNVGVANADVLAGDYDSYIENFARRVKSLDFKIRICLAPEMNGDWATWGIGKNGNTPQNHIQFWRYVVTKFRQENVDNVDWVWSPNVHYWGEKYTYSELYPGDDYVDYLGLEGYNWGTSQDWSLWQSFRTVFNSSYQDLTRLSDKPILITETASTERGGNKAEWIRKMFSDLKIYFPRVQGFTWFNIKKETDWRIESSLSSKTAFIESALEIFSLPDSGNNDSDVFMNSRVENDGNDQIKISDPRVEKVKVLALEVALKEEDRQNTYQDLDQVREVPVRSTFLSHKKNVDLLFWFSWGLGMMVVIGLLFKYRKV